MNAFGYAMVFETSDELWKVIVEYKHISHHYFFVLNLRRVTFVSLRAGRPDLPGARFSEVPKLFGRHNSLCVFKTKVVRGEKLHSYFNFPSLYNIWKVQLYTISGTKFYKWFFWPEIFPGCSRSSLPLVGTWWHEFVSNLMERQAFIDSVWRECTQLKY